MANKIYQEQVIEKLKNLSEYLATSLISKTNITLALENGELNLTTTTEDLPNIILFLKLDKSCQFTTLISICGADYPKTSARFEVIYHLLSIVNNIRIRVKLRVAIGQKVPSLIELFPNSNWYEREVFDMYGVEFENHPDMRRILTDYGFEGHPLRKDFPLTGFVEVHYDNDQEKVVYKPVDLRQAYRTFDFTSPWAGPEDAFKKVNE